MGKYVEILNKLYLESRIDEEDEMDSKLQFLGDSIFDFTTYDGGVSELFASKMLEVIDVILTNKNFEYQKSEDQYLNYLTMINMPFLQDKLDWGTSIRGAWFDDFNDYGVMYNQLIIPKGELKEFLSDIIEWSKVEAQF